MWADGKKRFMLRTHLGAEPQREQSIVVARPCLLLLCIEADSADSVIRCNPSVGVSSFPEMGHSPACPVAVGYGCTDSEPEFLMVMVHVHEHDPVIGVRGQSIVGAVGGQEGVWRRPGAQGDGGLGDASWHCYVTDLRAGASVVSAWSEISGVTPSSRISLNRNLMR